MKAKVEVLDGERRCGRSKSSMTTMASAERDAFGDPYTLNRNNQPLRRPYTSKRAWWIKYCEMKAERRQLEGGAKGPLPI